MAVIKEWKCAAHGDFEGSHPICPELGCDSASVERAFRTPVSVSQGKYKRFDGGLRQTADRMNIANWKTAREGESSFAGRAPIGQELLWGKDIEKTMGRPMAQQIAAAQAPLKLPGKDVAKDPYLTMNNGMRAVANEVGLTQGRLPKAEITRPMRDESIGS